MAVCPLPFLTGPNEIVEARIHGPRQVTSGSAIMTFIADERSEMMSQLTGCPVCGGTNRQAILDRDHVPLFCNVLWNSREEAIQAERGRLQLVFCTDCSLIYNAAFNPQLVKYAEDYENSQHFSPRFSQYLETLARRLVADYDIRGQEVVEIGCGDARFLRLICEAGHNRGVGFDPAAPKDLASGGDLAVTIVQELYSESSQMPPPDFVCCRHVLEHIFNPIDFLNTVHRTLRNRPDSHVYFEVPNVLAAMRDLAVWEFLYEHGQYFSESSLARLFAHCGFEVLEITETFAGQFLSLVAKPTWEAPRRWQAEHVLQQLADSQVSAFESHYMRTVTYWREDLQRRLEQGQNIAIWGAGTKGVMFLNSVPGGEGVQYAIDVNPRKHGCYVTGTGQRIVSPGELKQLHLDVVLVMNPAYEAEIRTEMKRADCHAQVLAV